MPSAQWSIDSIEVKMPDQLSSKRIDVFRDQTVSVIDRNDLKFLKATDSLYHQDDGERHTLAAVTFTSTPVDDSSEVEDQNEEELKEIASPVWRMASFIFSFVTQIAMGVPAVVPPSVIPEERRDNRVFGLETKGTNE